MADVLFTAIQMSVLPLIEHKTAKPCLRFSFEKGACDRNASKIGGIPYFPVGAEYPLSSMGTPLYFFLQLNFAEMSPLAAFPKKGILQFFINNDMFLGMNLVDMVTQDDFRIVYYAEDDLPQETPEMPAADPSLPIHGEAKICFKEDMSVLHPSDFSFDMLCREICEGMFSPAQVDQACEMTASLAEREFDGSGNRIGSHPFFRDTDPRAQWADLYADKQVSLLQIDTADQNSEAYGIALDGYRTMNFLISEEDLKNLDFSNVLYSWMTI
ncbi:MAG: DUF1963 domain-containing protein [Christensenellaceae bacterium]|nr:DUF1963 domain-containing protein [Christensenellaceae bacterium]